MLGSLDGGLDDSAIDPECLAKYMESLVDLPAARALQDMSGASDVEPFRRNFLVADSVLQVMESL